MDSDVCTMMLARAYKRVNKLLFCSNDRTGKKKQHLA